MRRFQIKNHFFLHFILLNFVFSLSLSLSLTAIIRCFLIVLKIRNAKLPTHINTWIKQIKINIILLRLFFFSQHQHFSVFFNHDYYIRRTQALDGAQTSLYYYYYQYVSTYQYWVSIQPNLVIFFLLYCVYFKKMVCNVGQRFLSLFFRTRIIVRNRVLNVPTFKK